MNTHRLGVEVIDTMNPAIFKIVDLSVYSNTLPFVCPRLWITAPGFQYSAEIQENLLIKNFDLTLTACNLELQRHNCDSRMDDLPDGLYAIKYAVSPYEYIFTEENHLRTTKLMQKIEKAYCRLEAERCHTNKESESKLQKIYSVEAKVRMAKAKVSCGSVEEGLWLFNHTDKEADKLICKNC